MEQQQGRRRSSGQRLGVGLSVTAVLSALVTGSAVAATTPRTVAAAAAVARPVALGVALPSAQWWDPVAMAARASAQAASVADTTVPGSFPADLEQPAVQVAGLGLGLAGWGSDRVGQLGDGGANTSRLLPVGAGALPTSVVQTATGVDQTLLLTAAGAVLAVGGNDAGQLGDGTHTSRLGFVRVPGIPAVSAVSASSEHSLGLTVDGRVLAWGSNRAGQAGDGTTVERPSPVVVPGLPVVRAVAAGYLHSLALDASGQVWAWGDDTFGQLGDAPATPPTAPVTSPVAVHLPAGAVVTAISAGGSHSLALLTDGTVLAWGDDSRGQLGDGRTPADDLAPTWTPAPVVGLPAGDPVVAVSAGRIHSMALLRSGEVWTWGDDLRGELGDGGAAEASSLPVKVQGLPASPVVSISAGDIHSLAVTADGTAFAWGYDGAGQLGDGSQDQQTTAKAVAGVPQGQVLAVSAGGDHSIALLRSAFSTGLPVVTTQPAGARVPPGTPVTLHAAASGSPAPTVQWRVSDDHGTTWSDVPGATSGDLGIVSADQSGTTLYEAVFTNPNGTVTTVPASIDVVPLTPPVVTTQPASTTTVEGQRVTLTSAANGSPDPTVQWQVSTDGGTTFVDVPGATAGSIVLTPTRADDGTRYRAVWTNASGQATSDPALLHVTSATDVDAVTVVRGNPATGSTGDGTVVQAATGTRTLPTGTVTDGSAAAPTGTGSLPFTGGAVLGWLLVGVGLVTTGSSALLMARRRRRA